MIGVILAGGAGTRLWPVSRAYWPKFLLTFPTSNKKSKSKIAHPISSVAHHRTLIQETFLRLLSMTSPRRIFAVTNEEHKFFIKENILELSPDFPAFNNIISEPVARDTLAAVCSAAIKTWLDFSDEPMVICPSDHIIKDKTNFRRAVRTALGAAHRGAIVIFGIRPTRPETGYGYIRPQPPLSSNLPPRRRIRHINNGVLYSVKSFAEKPSLEKARRFFNSGEWFWNAGIFIMKPSVLFEEIEKHLPDFYRLIKPLISDKRKNFSEISAALSQTYPRLPSVSMDYGIIEKSARVAVIPVESGWDDIGDWGALGRIYPTDTAGNVLIGDVVSFDTRDSFVVSKPLSAGGRLIGTVGLKDIVIVDTPDALLVAHKNSAQNVRELVKTFLRRGPVYAETTLRHKVVPRPWGEYEVISSARGYKVKIIKVLPHKKLSLQKHLLRSESWTALKGTAIVIKNGKRFVLKEGETIEVPRGAVHRLENSANKEIHILEISRGRYIGEDDIVRVEDDFGRN